MKAFKKTDNICEYCRGPITDMCYNCGAPQCCYKCCKETTAQLNQDNWDG